MSTFKIGIEQLQPSQLYINQRKLDRVNEWINCIDLDQVILPVIHLGGRVTLTDGHTRAFALYELGIREFNVILDEDDLDYRAYERCVDWCQNDSIQSIADLKTRIIHEDSFRELWLKRCSEMHLELGEIK